MEDMVSRHPKYCTMSACANQERQTSLRSGGEVQKSGTGCATKYRQRYKFVLPEGAKSCQKHEKATAVGGFFGRACSGVGGECTTKLPFLSKIRGKVLCIRVFDSMRFEPIRSASALGEQRHAHAVGTLHLFDHELANGVEFAVGNGEIEFVVHLQDHFCV